MVNRKEDLEKILINFRIPRYLPELVQIIANAEEKDKTEIYVRAIREYVEKYNSRICQGCHAVNPKKAHFCLNCGLPLDPDGLAEFQRIREYINKNPRVLIDNAERIISESKDIE